MRFRIISHNVVRMQRLPELTGIGPEESLGVTEILTWLYLSLDPQVVCLQEVPSADYASWLAESLGMEVRFEPEGVSSNCGAALFIAPELVFTYVPVSNLRKEGFERTCQLGEVRLGDNELALCNVHLPLDAGDADDEKKNGRPGEIDEIVSLTPELIVGDLNFQPQSPAYMKLIEAGYIDTAAAMEKGKVPTCGKVRIDYIWVHSQAGLELIDYEVISRTKTISDSVIRSVSDHLPVTAAFNVASSKTGPRAKN